MNSMKIGRRVALLLSTGLVLAACEGSNLFEDAGNGAVGNAVNIDLSAQTSITSGQTLPVTVLAQASGGLQLIQISSRGAVDRDTAFTTSGTIFATTYNLVVPLVSTDTAVVVSARATDMLGNFSNVDSVRVRITP